MDFLPLPRRSSLLDHELWNSSDLLQVDDLLDFSNDDIDSLVTDHPCPSSALVPDSNCILPSPVLGLNPSSGRTPAVVDAHNHSLAEPLYVPPDELAELDWLSPFVAEDPYTIDKNLQPLLNSNSDEKCSSGGRNESESLHSKNSVYLLEESNLSSIPRPTSLVKARPRSKRSRTGGRVWSLHMLVSISQERSMSSGKAVSEDSGEDSQSSSLDYEAGDSFRPKKKATKGGHAKKFADDSQPARRCTHCQIQKTPQWRAGPMGPKTLCNACGVRYKSGRLVPEYRPAASPSFISDIHSNSHKKILEMRRQRDPSMDGEEFPKTLSSLAGENSYSTSDISVEFEEANASDNSTTSNDTAVDL